MITGVRGSGITVFMTDISRTLAKDKRWVVVDLSVERDLLEGLATRLNKRKSLSQLFSDAQIDLSFFECLGLKSNQLSTYRRRLVNKGIIDKSQRGKISFTLPYFDEYVLEQYGEEDFTL